MNPYYLIISIMVTLAGCGTSTNVADIKDGYILDPTNKIAVTEVSNRTGQSIDIDIETIFRDALVYRLKEQDLFIEHSSKNNLTISTQILGYQKGNAFKRWLMPGYGSTTLSTASQLTDSEDNIIVSIQSSRTIDGGGVYTIGGWNDIFYDVAEDIVYELLNAFNEGKGVSE
ncbi:DUF4410 domain-containing protein [Porticoccus sp.]